MPIKISLDSIILWLFLLKLIILRYGFCISESCLVFEMEFITEIPQAMTKAKLVPSGSLKVSPVIHVLTIFFMYFPSLAKFLHGCMRSEGLFSTCPDY